MSDNAQSNTNISESPMNPSETNNTRSVSSSSPPIHRPSKISKIQYFSDDEEEEEEEEDLEEEEKINIEAMSKNPRFQRYLVAIEYMGTRFSGCQQQRPSFRTVVGVLKDAFQKFLGQPVSVTCSSRTDTGVHALSNVCHVDVERISKRKPDEVLPPHEPDVVKKAVNHFLQNEGDIMVIDVLCIPATFHARHKAQERTYFYRLLSGPEPLSIFEKDRAWHVPDELNIFAMQKACSVLVGDHDFSSFRGSRCQAKSPLRTLDELNVTELLPSPSFPSSMDTDQNNCNGKDFQPSSTKSETDLPVGSNSSLDALKNSNGGTTEAFGVRRSHRCIVITARARAFLYHQVRLLVGVLKSVGTGELTIPDVERILNAKSVLAASPMAPACGLYLANVKYDMSKDT